MYNPYPQYQPQQRDKKPSLFEYIVELSNLESAANNRRIASDANERANFEVAKGIIKERAATASMMESNVSLKNKLQAEALDKVKDKLNKRMQDRFVKEVLGSNPELKKLTVDQLKEKAKEWRLSDTGIAAEKQELETLQEWKDFVELKKSLDATYNEYNKANTYYNSLPVDTSIPVIFRLK